MSDPKVNLPDNALVNAAHIFLDALPEDVRVPIEDTGLYLINHEWDEALAGHFQHFIAYCIAAILEAGSERDAVMENEWIHDAILKEIHTWCNHGDNEPNGLS